MGEARRKWGQALRDALVEGKPVIPRPEADLQFLQSEGVLPETISVNPPPPVAENPLWMLGAPGTPTYQRTIAFTMSVGGRFGDVGLTTRFILDAWSRSPAGLRWTLDPVAPTGVMSTLRAEGILSGCLVQTRVGLSKLAERACARDLEAAIIRAIDEHMTMLGLDRYIPEQAEAV